MHLDPGALAITSISTMTAPFRRKTRAALGHKGNGCAALRQAIRP